jgi:hypothetical protein
MASNRAELLLASPHNTTLSASSANMIREILLVHESHTDIGYTHGQRRSLRWHGEFIKQAMDLVDAQPDFKWACETFAQVESFWSIADTAARERFLSMVRSGRVSLSACWGNFTELPDNALLASLTNRARQFADEHRLPMTAGMMADVNGCPLAYARTLADHGISFLLTHVHGHHGHVPFGNRVLPFWWDLSDGRKLLVHHGEHYHQANELGLMPGAEVNYTVFRDKPASFDDAQSDARIEHYVRGIESSGWPYEWYTVSGSGLMTDNSPPSSTVAARLQRFNALAAKRSLPKVRLVTLDELARVIAADGSRLPTFAGDWPDWWADGTACDPEGVQLFRHAQRQRRVIVSLAKQSLESQVNLTELDQWLGMYAEHTFGHSHSVTHPWNPLAQQLRQRKVGYAAQAAELAEVLIEDVTEPLGFGPLAYDRPLRFRVTNPNNVPLRALVELEWEASEAQRWHVEGNATEVFDTATLNVIPSQSWPSMRGWARVADVTLGLGETRELGVRIDTSATTTNVAAANTSIANDRSPLPADWRVAGRRGVHDLAGDPFVVTAASNTIASQPKQPQSVAQQIRTDFAELSFSDRGRLLSWTDRCTGQSLLRAGQREPFALIADRSVAPLTSEAQSAARASMGRNRRLADAQELVAESLQITRTDTGELYDTFEIQQQLDGFELLRTRWTFWHRLPRVDIELQTHKIGSWHAENVFCPLPFDAGDDSVVWFDRGLPMRPWRDQLPGTLTDYMGIQDGLAWCGRETGVAVATSDAHLMHCGDLAHRQRKLMGDPNLPATPDQVHAWLMTNYWETNFAAELGGFYCFRFSVGWGPEFVDPKTALNWCRQTTEGVHAIRLVR